MKEKALPELSVEHLNSVVKRLAENHRRTNIAKVLNEKNALLKLGVQRTELESEYTYWRTKVDQDLI